MTALVADRDEARDIAEYGVRPSHRDTHRRAKRSAAVCETPTECSTLRVIASKFGERKTAEAVNVVGTRNVLEAGQGTRHSSRGRDLDPRGCTPIRTEPSLTRATISPASTSRPMTGSRRRSTTRSPSR